MLVLWINLINQNINKCVHVSVNDSTTIRFKFGISKKYVFRSQPEQKIC